MLRMKNSELGKSFDSFADDLLSERTTRPLVIVGASKIDVLLGEILRGSLLPKISKPKEPDELLDRDTGPLTTFSSRIKMCRRMGLIDETMYLALEKLRTIRNQSAHNIAFDDAKSPIRDLFLEFKKHIVTRVSFQFTKERFFDTLPLQPIEEWQCLLLTICAVLEAIRVKVKPITGNKRAMNASWRWPLGNLLYRRTSD
jgi:hypothetical protein